MMVTTHVFAGLAIAVPLAAVAPEYATSLAVGAIVGGIAPDLDVVFEHRRTLHFPLAGGVCTLVAIALALVVTTPVTVAIGMTVATAWVHAVSDVLGAGPTVDPWHNPSDRAVYNHLRGRWLRPRRVIRYDGAPEDAVVGILLAIPTLFVFDGWVLGIVGGGVIVSLGYTLVRRRIPRWIA